MYGLRDRTGNCTLTQKNSCSMDHATWTKLEGVEEDKELSKPTTCARLSARQKDCSPQLQNAAKSRSCLFDAALRSCEPVFRRRASASGDKNVSSTRRRLRRRADPRTRPLIRRSCRSPGRWLAACMPCQYGKGGWLVPACPIRVECRCHHRQPLSHRTASRSSSAAAPATICERALLACVCPSTECAYVTMAAAVVRMAGDRWPMEVSAFSRRGMAITGPGDRRHSRARVRA